MASKKKYVDLLPLAMRPARKVEAWPTPLDHAREWLRERGDPLAVELLAFVELFLDDPRGLALLLTEAKKIAGRGPMGRRTRPEVRYALSMRDRIVQSGVDVGLSIAVEMARDAFPKLGLRRLRKTAVDIVGRACADRSNVSAEDYVREIFRQGEMPEARIKNLFSIARTAKRRARVV